MPSVVCWNYGPSIDRSIVIGFGSVKNVLQLAITLQQRAQQEDLLSFQQQELHEAACRIGRGRVAASRTPSVGVIAASG